MKYLGAISDPKDIATKGYVDSKGTKYVQTFTLSAGSSAYAWTIPYDETYTPAQFSKIKVYTVASNGNVRVGLGIYVAHTTISSEPVWRVYFYFYNGYPSSGDVLYIENDFGDNLGYINAQM